MGLFDGLAKRMGYAKTAQPSNMQPWQLATAANAYYDMPGSFYAESTGELYQKLSWLQVAVKTLAQACAAVPLGVYQANGEETEAVANHPFEKLLKRPNPLQSRFELLESTFSYYTLTGNAYWFLNRTAAEPAEIWVIPSQNIQPVPDGNSYLSHYEYNTGTQTYKIPVENICHFKRFNPNNQFVGLSSLESLALVANGDIAMQRWNANLFGRDNAKVPGALAFSSQFTDTDWERLKSEIRSQWGGTNRSGAMLLRGMGEGGVQWVNMALSQKDMEFLASRAFTKEEIWSMIAPGLASMLAINATEANSKTGLAVFNSMAVWPALNAVSEKITNDIMPFYGEQYHAEFDDVRSIDDRVTEIAEQQEYAKTHTIDEIRAKYYGDPPLPETGMLLPAQVSPTTALPYESEPDNAATEKPVEQPEEPEEQGEDAEEVKAKWKAKALKALKRGKPASVPFETPALSLAEQTRIREGLAACKTADDVAGVFEDKAAELLAALIELKRSL